MVRQALSSALLACVAAAALPAQGTVYKSALHDFTVVTVAPGLVQPWGIAFVPGGDILITERPGRLRIVRKGKLLDTPVDGVPTVATRGQAGLLDVAVHPDFANNHYVYLTYSKPVDDSGKTTTAVARARFEHDKLVGLTDIFVARTVGTVGHFGSRLAFDGKGHLFVTVGDRMVPPTGNLEAHPAQDLSNHHGKVLRLNDDGSVPNDNPFVGRAGAQPEIYSYGHRNMQGLIVNAATGDLWETEHGPQGGDELNLIKPGTNYGWPVIGFGVNYRTGLAIHGGTTREGMEQPVSVWVPSIGASGLMLYTGDKFPAWKGMLFAGGLSGERVTRFTLDGQKADMAEHPVRGLGRIRDVRQGPDGFIYLAIDDATGKPTSVVRLEPVARR
ncbi:MAG: PQQ-dependent sugar dehydrogenase [Gemmatimonadaceae bacterium]|nr:PQQ-dependent sugar dehydrogenase [Gemmatimonadaceae bacterium]